MVEGAALLNVKLEGAVMYVVVVMVILQRMMIL